MIKKLIIVFILLLFLPKLEASIVIMDSDSGRILFEKGKDEKKLIASTTKIMTAIIALEYGNINDIFEAKEEILEVDGSSIYLKKGEKISLLDLLYGLMLQSGNDAAQTIATNVMNYDIFINKMNDKAKKLKMRNTFFENPHGLDDMTKNYSTAYDMALLMKYAIQNKKFIDITSTKKYISKTSENTHIWYNKNKLLSNYQYAISGKIGYTKKSGQVFVSYASNNNKNLIIVSIDEPDKFNLHKKLYEDYFKKYEIYEILNPYTFLLKENKYKEYNLYIKNNYKVLLSENEIEKLKINYNINNKIINNEVGEIHIIIRNETIHKEKILAIKIDNRIKKIKSLLSFWK